MLLIDARLQYTRRYDLESKFDCCIWVELKLKGQKNILIQGGYRQWQIPREYDKDQSSKSIKSQLSRYKSIVNNFEKALKENKDIIIMMDDNLDDYDNKIYNKNIPLHTQTQKLQKYLT